MSLAAFLPGALLLLAMDRGPGGHRRRNRRGLAALRVPVGNLLQRRLHGIALSPHDRRRLLLRGASLFRGAPQCSACWVDWCRVNGMLLSIPIAWIAFVGERARRWPRAAAAVAPVVGALCFCAYLAWRVGDATPWLADQAAWPAQPGRSARRPPARVNQFLVDSERAGARSRADRARSAHGAAGHGLRSVRRRQHRAAAPSARIDVAGTILVGDVSCLRVAGDPGPRTLAHTADRGVRVGAGCPCRPLLHLAPDRLTLGFVS